MYEPNVTTLLMNELRMCGIPLEHCFQKFEKDWESFGVFKWEDILRTLATFEPGWVHVIFKDFEPVATKLQSPIDGTVVNVTWNNYVLQRLMAWMWWLEALEQGPSVDHLKLCLSELPKSMVQSHGRDGMDYRMFPWIRSSDLEDSSEAAGWLCFQRFREGLGHIIGKPLLHRTSSWWPPVLLAACRWCCHFMKFPGGRLRLDIMNQYFEELNNVNPEFRGQTLQLVLAFDDNEASLGGSHMIKTLSPAPFKFSDDLHAADLQPPEWPASFQ
jgi:hypothetical protein